MDSPAEDAMDHGPAPSCPLQLAVLHDGAHRNSQGGAGVGETGDRPRRARPLRLPLALASGVAAVAVVIWSLTAYPDPSRLRSLPPAERTALAERTLSNLREICRGRERPRDFCKDQASLLLELPECRGACRDAARDELLADMAVR
jgi:hypothetical protein